MNDDVCDRLQFAVEPGQYAYSAFQDIVQHPELAAPTIDNHNIRRALQGFVAMGRVALANEDMAEYRQWHDHTVDFIDTLQVYDIMPRDHTPIARLRLFGAIAGDIDAVDALHCMINAEASKKADSYQVSQASLLNEVLQLCVTHSIEPQAWIEPHTTTPDERAAAWSHYLLLRQKQQQQLGAPANDNEQSVPGVEPYMQDYFHGALSLAQAMQSGPDVLQLARSTADKQQVITCYSELIDKMYTGSWEPIGENPHTHDMITMATLVAVDCDIPLATRKAFVSTAIEYIPQHFDNIPTPHEANLHMAVAAMNNAPVIDIVEQVDAITSRGDTHPTYRAAARDSMLSSAAQSYARTGDIVKAAALITMIVTTHDYAKALDTYAQKGGNINLVRFGDEMQQLTEASAANLYLSPQRQARIAIAEFLEHSTDNNTRAMGTTLHTMAEQIGKQTGDRVDDRTFLTYVERLVARDASSAALGPKIVANLKVSTFGYTTQVRNLFSAMGSPELTAASWDAANSQTNYSRARYFQTYAEAALAAAGIIR